MKESHTDKLPFELSHYWMAFVSCSSCNAFHVYMELWSVPVFQLINLVQKVQTPNVIHHFRLMFSQVVEYWNFDRSIRLQTSATWILVNMDSLRSSTCLIWLQYLVFFFFFKRFFKLERLFWSIQSSFQFGW